MQAAYTRPTGANVVLMSSENARFYVIFQGPKYSVAVFRHEWTCRRFEAVDFFDSGRQCEKQNVRIPICVIWITWSDSCARVTFKKHRLTFGLKPKHPFTKFHLLRTCRRFEASDFFKSGRQHKRQRVRLKIWMICIARPDSWSWVWSTQPIWKALLKSCLQTTYSVTLVSWPWTYRRFESVDFFESGCQCERQQVQVHN